MKEQLKEALKQAMKAKDRIRLQAIRSVLSAVQYEEIQKQTDNLGSDGVIAILKSELKKRREAVEFAEKGGRAEMLEELRAEMAALESFLPQQLSVAELERLIGEMKAADPGLAMSGAMKQLKEKYAGLYDGKAASEVAKRLLT